MTENVTDRTEAVCAHAFTKGAIRVATEKLNGRVGKKAQPFDSTLAAFFTAFIREVTEFVWLDAAADLSYVTRQEAGWRKRLADENEKRLADMSDVAACVDFFVGKFHLLLPELSQPDNIVKEALLGVMNVATQVARMQCLGLDPAQLHVVFEPLPQGLETLYN